MLVQPCLGEAVVNQVVDVRWFVPVEFFESLEERNVHRYAVKRHRPTQRPKTKVDEGFVVRALQACLHLLSISSEPLWRDPFWGIPKDIAF